MGRRRRFIAAPKQFPELSRRRPLSVFLSHFDIDPPKMLRGGSGTKPGCNLWGPSDEDGAERSDARVTVDGPLRRDSPVTRLNSAGAEVKAAVPWERTEWR